jgi:HD-GYP domain-containing protein (c-di-GMP phosphodiesterase class II)
MKERTQYFWAMVLAQAACLAVGLWINHHLIVAFAQREDGEGLAKTRHQSETTSHGSAPFPPGSSGGSSVAAAPSAIAINAMTFVWIGALQLVIAYLFSTRVQEEMARRQTETERISLQRHNDLLRTRDAVIFGLAGLADSRDPETGKHLERIATYSTRLASSLARHYRYSDQITSSFVRLIGISSALHDIGKVGIRDAILLKPGKFEEQERASMQLHATIGGRCVKEIESRLGNSNFLQMAREIALCHHERWDGTGYPAKLAGDKIPLAARIVAIADVYDALASRRVYKEAFPHEKCVEIIKDGAGKAFDPSIVSVFLTLESDFREIAQQYRDAKDTVGAEQCGRMANCAEASVSEDDVLSAILEFAGEYTVDLSKGTSSPANTLEVEHVS